MLNIVNHKINQVLTYLFAHIIFSAALLQPAPEISREVYPAYYKFANLQNFGCQSAI